MKFQNHKRLLYGRHIFCVKNTAHNHCPGITPVQRHITGVLENTRVFDEKYPGIFQYPGFIDKYPGIWVVVVLRSPIHANEPSEYNGMLYRTSN